MKVNVIEKEYASSTSRKSGKSFELDGVLAENAQ